MPLNYSRYCNQEADSAMNAERLTTDPAARKAAWKRLADRVLTDKPLVYLFHRRCSGPTRRNSPASASIRTGSCASPA